MLSAVDDFSPKGLLLGRIEEKTAFDVSFFPCAADKVFPISDVGCGPCRETFVAASTMKIGLKGAGCAITRSDHESTFAQPCVEFGPRLSAHICVIRRRTVEWNVPTLWETGRVVNWGVIRKLFFCAVIGIAAVAGCHRQQNGAGDSVGSSSYKVYKLRGKVVVNNPSTGEVTLNHEAIPGFMDAMTMPYKLKDPSILSELHPGDVITADVLVSQDADASVLLDHIVVVAEGKPDYRPAVIYHVPAKGDAVPDFKLRNQDGRIIHLDQFRGKELLITFIYTRCPLPNFCPLVTHNFAVIDKQLEADPALKGKAHLLCVSFDPEHDTPDRLKAYGEQYIGSDAKTAFAHWDFAVPEKPVLTEMSKFFDVGMTDAADGTITHTLSTTLIGRDGKVRKFYPGNEWTPDQVLADVKQSLGA